MPAPETDEPTTNAATPETPPPPVPPAAEVPEQPTQETESDLAAQLEAAKAEAAANYDKFLRAVADLESFRRRTLREKDELRSMATAEVLEDIFPVLDNLALAINAARQPNADIKSLVGGVEMVLAQLRNALANHGLTEINPLGERFDPHQHEAVSQQPSDKVQDEHVAEVVRVGYSLNGRLLRPASVVVSSGPKQQEEKTQ